MRNPNIKYAIHESKFFSGVAAFYLMDEKGLPIESIMEMAGEEGLVIEWISFFTVAEHNKNYKKKSSVRRLREKCEATANLIWNTRWWNAQMKNCPEHFKLIDCTADVKTKIDCEETNEEVQRESIRNEFKNRYLSPNEEH